MRIKSLMKNKKAFSAIIAALILMLIAVAAGVVVYAYVMGWIGGIQTNPPASGIITIESYTSSSTNSTLYIRNHGTTSLTIDAIYIDGEIYIGPGTTINLIESTVNAIPVDDMKLKAGMVIKVVCTDGTTVSQTLV